MKYMIACLVGLFCGLVSAQLQQTGSLPVGIPWTVNPCETVYEGWESTGINLLPQPAPGGGSNFYWGCRIERPKSSKCTGECDSTATYTIDPQVTYETECECCEPSTFTDICPAAMCLVITGVNGCWKFEWREVPCTEHSGLQAWGYAVLSDCQCESCNSIGNGRRRRRSTRLSPPSLPVVEVNADSNTQGARIPREGTRAERDELISEFQEEHGNVNVCSEPREEVRVPVRNPFTRG